VLKSQIRTKYLQLRKKNYKENIIIDYKIVQSLIKQFKKKNPIIGGYFPVNYEIDCINILHKLELNKFKIALPVIKKNNEMEFYSYSFGKPLKTSNYGIPEPFTKKKVNPDILFVPLVAFDSNCYRIGYGGGYYDRYLKKLEKKKFFKSIGFAFSFQKTKHLPIEIFDKSLNMVITDKKIYK
tara:strand:+ start:497 stop:1042 length:546 start_codon:yes stop_codon:yes gene_type:complete